MKFHLKRILIITSLVSCIFSLIILLYLLFTNSPDDHLNFQNEHITDSDEEETEEIQSLTDKPQTSKFKFEPIDCLIDNNYTIPCYKHKKEVYVPHEWLKKHYELYGGLKNKDGKEVLSYEESYSKYHIPTKPYDYKGEYLWLTGYNVANREKVRCISAIKGVPITTQWEKSGHFYAVQIAQFGLSSFNRNLTKHKQRITELDNGEKHNSTIVEYIIPEGQKLERREDNEKKRKVLYVDGKNIIMKMKNFQQWRNDPILSFEVKHPDNKFSLTLVLKTDPNSAEEFRITYKTYDKDVQFKDGEIFYGIGTNTNTWKLLARELVIDLEKGFNVSGIRINFQKSSDLRLIQLEFNGKAYLDNIKLMQNANAIYAKFAADWFVESQNKMTGAWPITVKRTLGIATLHPPWYSAMAQSMVMSLLTRMYHVTGNKTYLESAKRGVEVYQVNSTDNGIRAYFMDKYVWFEEYPTNPHSFVLNGFIYGIFGLYDVYMSCNDPICQTAGQLFNESLISLRAMIPLFDGGFMSYYDLRHFTMKTSPNLARWDYHTVHIDQLLLIHKSFDPYKLFKVTAQRWIGYMSGYRAHHN